MKSLTSKIIAIFEVILIAFILTPFLTLGIYKVFPAFENWQTQTLGFPFPVFVHIVMVAISIITIKLHRKKLTDFGINFHNISYHLDITAASFVPVILANIPFGLGIDHTSWNGALILSIVQISLLFILGFLLRKKATHPSVGTASIVLLVFFSMPFLESTVWVNALVIFLTYALFVGFGEEILYRGFIQSRLNEVFGRPYQFFGVAFGFGAILTAILFGLTHVGILTWILGISNEIAWAWGFWTFFGGLVFGFIREKTGSILAPALLHGLPQAIASAVILFL